MCDVAGIDGRKCSCKANGQLVIEKNLTIDGKIYRLCKSHNTAHGKKTREGKAADPADKGGGDRWVAAHVDPRSKSWPV